MEHVRHVTAEPLTAVELEALLGDPGFLVTHPSVRHVEALADGGFMVFIDDAIDGPLARIAQAPERPPEVELHGPGKPCQALTGHPRAEWVEMFVDAVGHPEAAPRGWWHARIWLKAQNGVSAPAGQS